MTLEEWFVELLVAQWHFWGRLVERLLQVEEGQERQSPGGTRKLGAGGDDLDLLPPSNSQPGLSHFK